MWSKLDDALIDHRKVFEAAAVLKNVDGPAIALGMFAVCLMWTNKHLTDGFIPDAVLYSFKHVKRPRVVADALKRAGFLDRIEGGYLIHDFGDHNPSAADVKASREWDRRRKSLYSDPELLGAIRDRDQDRCRYCGCNVRWRDRRGPMGGQYDHIKPRGPNTLDNIVTACRRCNMKKGNRTLEQARMTLLAPPINGTKSEPVRN